MGTVIDMKELLFTRDQIIENLLSNFKSWDGSMESSIDIVEKNQAELELLKKVVNKLNTKSRVTQDEVEYKNKLNLILDQQKKLMLAIKKDKDALLQGMKQLHQKSRVMNSYISGSRGTVFVDKDV